MDSESLSEKDKSVKAEETHDEEPQVDGADVSKKPLCGETDDSQSDNEDSNNEWLDSWDSASISDQDDLKKKSADSAEEPRIEEENYDYDAVEINDASTQYFKEIEVLITKLTDDLNLLKEVKNLIKANKKTMHNYSRLFSDIISSIEQLYIENKKLMSGIYTERKLVITQPLKELIKGYRLFFSLVYVFGYMQRFEDALLSSIKGNFKTSEISPLDDLKTIIRMVIQMYMFLPIALTNAIKPAKKSLNMNLRVQREELVRISLVTNYLTTDIMAMDGLLKYVTEEEATRTMDILHQMDITRKNVINGRVLELLKYGTLMVSNLPITIISGQSSSKSREIIGFTDCFVICQPNKRRKAVYAVVMVLPFSRIDIERNSETCFTVSIKESNQQSEHHPNMRIDFDSKLKMQRLYDLYDDYTFPAVLKCENYLENSCNATLQTIDIGSDCTLCHLAICEPRYQAIVMDNNAYHFECAKLFLKELNLNSYYMCDESKSPFELIPTQTSKSSINYLDSFMLAYEIDGNICCHSNIINKSGEFKPFSGKVPAELMRKLNFSYGGSKINVNLPSPMQYPDLQLFISNSSLKTIQKAKESQRNSEQNKGTHILKQKKNIHKWPKTGKHIPEPQFKLTPASHHVEKIVEESDVNLGVLDFTNISYSSTDMILSIEHNNNTYFDVCDFYHGVLTREEAQYILSDKIPNSFLLRCSKNQGETKLVLMIKARDNSEFNMRLRIVPNPRITSKFMWLFDNKFFFSLEQIVAFFSLNKLIHPNSEESTVFILHRIAPAN
ncbi:MAG: hypothetical protein MHMPM18_000046 [Marteilia pararefringens]